MKHVFRSTVIGAAALVLPCASLAEERPATSTSPTTGETQATPLGALQSGGTFTAQDQAGPVSGGVMVHGGKAYIVHRLQTEMSLPDGSKVQPNGTIEAKDGSLRQVGEDQMLSLDGRMLRSPFEAASQPSSSPETDFAPVGAPGSSSPATDGSTAAPGTSPDLSNPPVTRTPPSATSPNPSQTTTDPIAPAASQPSEPNSTPVVPPPQPNPLESTSPGSGLQDTSPQTLTPNPAPSTNSSTTEPFRESNTVPQQPERISTDPTRDRLD